MAFPRHIRVFRTRVTAFVLGLALTLVSTSHATADSDGYYCVGKDYLAYQFAFTNGASEHYLAVISLARGFALDEPATIELPAFQVHGMRCNATSIELHDLTTIYGVDISDRDTPTLIGRKPLTPDRDAGFLQTNLGLWAFSGFRTEGTATITVPLPRPGTGLDAALLLRLREEPLSGGSRRRHSAELVIANQRSGRVISRSIFTGTNLVAVD